MGGHACVIQGFSDQAHIGSSLDKGRSDEVHLVLAAEILNIIDIIGGENWQVHLDARQVHVLALPQLLGVHGLATHLVVQHLV